ncbi:hypothetical protein PU02_1309 [Bartonella ancashensis]|uniref:Uncharacterized protein n=1 Tax=Bartonella ancashensis TaxID=1318743 RepID=A0A0M5L1A9_9HYPH|nr:hypothetical protein PU02_1309 [Bartonella ancashensis]
MLPSSNHLDLKEHYQFIPAQIIHTSKLPHAPQIITDKKIISPEKLLHHDKKIQKSILQIGPR